MRGDALPWGIWDIERVLNSFNTAGECADGQQRAPMDVVWGDPGYLAELEIRDGQGTRRVKYYPAASNAVHAPQYTATSASPCVLTFLRSSPRCPVAAHSLADRLPRSRRHPAPLPAAALPGAALGCADAGVGALGRPPGLLSL